MRHEDGSDFMDLRPEAIRADVEGSLRRLGLERLDLLQIHDPDRGVPIEETWGAVLELVAQGKVRHGGISNHPVELIDRALAVGPVAALQHQYSLLERAVEDEILPFAARRGLGVIVWAPLAMGFLTDALVTRELPEGDFRRTHPFAGLDLEGVRAALRSAGGSAAQVSIAWTVSHPAVTGAIVGVRNEREAAELAHAANLRLTPNERATIASCAPP